MGDSDLFAVYLHHGGRFVSMNNHDVYVGGECEGTFDLDPDLFGYFDAADLVQKLGYVSWSRLWYQIPKSQSYRVLKTDKEVMVMLSFLKPETRVLHLYVDGGKISEEPTGNDGEGKNIVNESENDVGGASVHTDMEGEVENESFVDDLFDKTDMDVEANKGEWLVEKDGKESGCNESDWGDGSSEDIDYYPCDGESSDDSLDDDELASDDDEYIESRKKVKTGGNIFDLIDEDHSGGMGYKPMADDVESEYASSDGDVCSDSTDDALEGKRDRRFKSSYDPRTKPKKLQLQLGMRFENGLVCRKALRDNAIATGKYIKFIKVSKTICEAKCRPPCEWRVYGSVVKAHDIFIIKTYNPKHTCTRKNNNKLVSSKWISEKYINVFRVHPNMPVKLLFDDIRRRFKTLVGKDRLYRARSLAQDMIRGSVEEHYALLRRYVAELIRVDRDGKYLLFLGEGSVFRGLYIGHSALRNGFKKSCRPVIGLDGCFLKTYLGGILLCAVGKDGNNQMFPIAWAVVEVENEECWNWFLQNLLEDLAISEGCGWTFISDQQKGLMNAVSKLAPLAEHRNCARHVYMNWKKNHKGTSLKNIFWRTVRSTNVEEYKMNLEEMKAENLDAYEDFIARDVTKFCKAFLSLHPSSDMIDNNIAETFNGYIQHARGMHIIHMCEHIRRSLMVRQVENLHKMAMVHDRVCPMIVKKLEKVRKESIQAYVFPNMEKKFEVELNGVKFVVDLIKHTCTCRKWDLTGIPCKHACSAIHFEGQEPSAYVHNYYTVDRYLQAYKYALEPLVGEHMWPEAEGYNVKPPTIRKMPGRPKKVRRRDPEEDPKRPNKLKKFGYVMTCSTCRQKGHNSKTCTNEKVPPPPKGKRGRPRKDPSQPQRPQKKGKEKAEATSKPQKEKRIARKEAGVHINEPTGNMYYSMPGQRGVRQLNKPSSSNATVSSVSRAIEGPSTQESGNPAARK